MQLDIIFGMSKAILQKLLVNSQDQAAQLTDQIPLTDHFYDDYFVTTTVAVTGHNFIEWCSESYIFLKNIMTFTKNIPVTATVVVTK